MFGQLLSVAQQTGLVRLVFGIVFAARAGSGDGANGHLAIARTHEDFGGRANQGEIGQIEIIEKRGRVYPPQGAVEREGRKLEIGREALRKHHLKDVASLDIILRGGHHLAIAARRKLRFKHRFGRRVAAHAVGGQRCGKRPLSFVERGDGAVQYHVVFQRFRWPYRGDQEHLIAEPVEDHDQTGPNEQQIRKRQRVFRRAWQFFDQPDGLITKIADQAGQSAGQGVRHIHRAFGNQGAQLRQRIVR